MSKITITIDTPDTLDTKDFVFEVDDALNMGFKHPYEMWTVEPKTKRGRWIVVDEELNDCDGHRTFYWYECDNCGARPPKNQWGHEWHSNFCPNCGAKMESEE